MPPKRKSSAVSSAAPSLAGLTFCMTGTMSVSRAEMEAFIQAHGGEVAKTVTNKCSHLISAETGTKKCADAEKKGAIVVDEAWVREQCAAEGGGGGAMEEVAEVAESSTQPEQQEFVYMVSDSSSGGKFWQCTLKGSGTAVVYGKLGSSGSRQVKEHGTAAAAKKYFDKVGKEKINKGYEPAVPHQEEKEEEEEEAAPAPKKKAAAPAPKKKAAAAPPSAVSGGGGAAKQAAAHLVCASSSGGKFWDCQVRGSDTIVTFGKVNSDGATQVKSHGSEEAAQKYFDKILKEKLKKGYA